MTDAPRTNAKRHRRRRERRRRVLRVLTLELRPECLKRFEFEDDPEERAGIQEFNGG